MPGHPIPHFNDNFNVKAEAPHQTSGKIRNCIGYTGENRRSWEAWEAEDVEY
jgi:hypothetical protein